MSPTQFSVREAALRAGVTRQTMFRYIKEGKISATQDSNGQKCIDLSELLRVFRELQPVTDTPATPSDSQRSVTRNTATAPATTQFQMEILRLQAQLEIKTAELDLAKERINELKAAQHDVAAEKNRFLEIIERQSLLLAAPKQAAPARQRAAVKKPAASAQPKPAAKKPAASTTKKAPAPAPAASKTDAKKTAKAKRKK